MPNTSHYLGILTIGASVGLTVIEAESAQAAAFAFYFGSESSSGYGYLSFTNSNLKGIGVEKASLSQLRSFNNSNFYFETYPFFIFPSFSSSNPNNPGDYVFNLADGNPVFTFESGELKGIEYSESRSFYDRVSDPNSVSPGGYSSSQGYIDFSLLGDRYEASISGVAFFKSEFCQPGDYVYNEFGEVIDYKCYYESFSQEFDESDEGLISFETFEPIEAIPEPLTLLGVGTALGFGTFFKRQIARKSKKIK